MTLPHPPRRLPILGDVFGQSMSAPMQALTEMASEFGSLFEVKTMGVRYVVAAGAGVVAELNDESRFAKHVGPELVAIRPAAGNGLFTADNEDPAWQTAHDLLVPAFSQSAMRGYHHTMLDVVDELVGKWDQRVGQPMDIPADMTRVALESIGRATAGYSFGSFTATREHPFVHHMVGTLKGGLTEAFLRQSWLPRPAAAVAGWGTRRHARHLNAIVDDVIRSRKEAADRPNDLLELMLSPGPDGNRLLDDTNIRYQMITFLVAGHETTSGAIAFALHHLASRPDVVSAARAEIDAVWGNVEHPSYEQVSKLRYVRRVLDETLRLHPTVPGYFRRARTDTVLDGDYRVAAGDWFLVLVGGLHRDPLWGDQVDQFDPDQFLPDRVRVRPAQLYKPFGTGMRSCIGRQFAIHEGTLVLASLLRRYDLTATPGYQLQVAERLTAIPRGLQLVPTLRGV